MQATEQGIRISADTMIALVVAEAEAREEASLPSLREMNEAFRPSASFGQRMDKLFRSLKRRERLRRWGRRARRVALCLAVLIAVFSCAMLPVQAVREAVVDTLIEWHEESLDLVYTSDDPGSRTLPGKFELGYIPEGFVLSENSVEFPNYIARYYEKDGDYLGVEIQIMDGKAQIVMDNEYTTYYSIQFDSHDALWGSREGGTNLLSWSDDGLVYLISGALPLNELIRIAENITLSPAPAP